MDPLSTCVLFEQFLVERRYLRNVTASTLEWYQTAFKALQKTLGVDVPPLTKSNLQQFVIAMRQRDMKPVSCNTYIKAVNAFCLWLHDEGHLDERLQLSLLKVEQRVIQTLSESSVETPANHIERVLDFAVRRHPTFRSLCRTRATRSRAFSPGRVGRH